MQDRFLFRGKRTDNGKWALGDFSRRDSRFAPQLNTTYGISDNYGVFTAVDHATIGQCTGLKDKNGKLIFEGDICKDSLGWVFTVVWDNECSRFIGKHDKPRGDTYICYIGREPIAVEIIGNIHDTAPTD